MPFTLVGQLVDLRYTTHQVACWHQGKQVALHVRSYRPGQHTTLLEHMPPAHQKQSQWSEGRFLQWAQTIGPHTFAFVQQLFTLKKHPEQAFRACLGLLNLARQFEDSRLEKACHRAQQLQLHTVKSVKSILLNHLEEAPLPQAASPAEHPLLHHTNIRGKTYYQQHLQGDKPHDSQ